MWRIITQPAASLRETQCVIFFISFLGELLDKQQRPEKLKRVELCQSIYGAGRKILWGEFEFFFWKSLKEAERASHSGVARAAKTREKDALFVARKQAFFLSRHEFFLSEMFFSGRACIA